MKNNDWSEEFDKNFLGTGGEHEFSEKEIKTGTWTIYAYAVKSFLQSQIDKSYQKGREDGAIEAYSIFLNVIKDAKKHFPNSKDFEIVSNVKDIEKSLKQLSQRPIMSKSYQKGRSDMAREISEGVEKEMLRMNGPSDAFQAGFVSGLFQVKELLKEKEGK